MCLHGCIVCLNVASCVNAGKMLPSRIYYHGKDTRHNTSQSHIIWAPDQRVLISLSTPQSESWVQHNTIQGQRCGCLLAHNLQLNILMRYSVKWPKINFGSWLFLATGNMILRTPLCSVRHFMIWSRQFPLGNKCFSTESNIEPHISR